MCDEIIAQDEEVWKKVRQNMKDMMIETLAKLPVALKIRYYANTISQMEEKDQSKVDWNLVSKILKSNVGPYDYNILDGITSLEKLLSTLVNNHAASCGLGFWRKINCCECRNDFYMDLHEVNFYQKKGFVLPKRCYSCRQARKNH